MKISSSKNNYQFSDNEYGFITLSGNQNTGLANTNPIKLDTLVGNVTFNPVTYQITLKKNRTYRLFASFLAGYSGNTGLFDFRFYNVTAGAYIGTTADQLVMTYTAHAGTQPNAFVILTPTVDTVIELRIVSPTALSLIYAAYSYVEVQQINIVSPVIQDPSRVYAYVSKPLALAVTADQGGFVLNRGYGTFYKTSDGKWYMEFNINCTYTAHEHITLTIADVVFYNITNGQAVSACQRQGSTQYCIQNFAVANTGNLTFVWSANTVANFCTSGFVELNAKPTIAGVPSDV